MRRKPEHREEFPVPSIGRTVQRCYEGCLANARLVHVVFAAVLLVAAAHLDDFTFDASADTLVAQGDPELAFYRAMVDRFDEHEFLVLTYTPADAPLFERETLDRLGQLQRELEDVEGIAGVTSLLDAPLLRSPPVPLTQLADGYRTLADADVDLQLARQELTSSPLFSELLVSRDGGTTALRVDLDARPDLEAARSRRDHVLGDPTLGRRAREAADDAYRKAKARAKEERAQLIARVRAVRDRHTDHAKIFLGGVPMVTADVVQLVERDMQRFGVAVILLLAGALFLFFRRLRWVLVPVGTVGATLLVVVGTLGFLGVPATAISANFVSLISIITISFTIHLIARYRELSRETGLTHVGRVYETMRSKLAPVLYTALTTGVAFASLVASDIVPVIQFGWIMLLGIVVAFLVTYGFFAGILVLLPDRDEHHRSDSVPLLTRLLCRLVLRGHLAIVLAGILAGVAAAALVPRLEIENRFVDYFREGSEIHDGMKEIDRKLGGTIPIDIVLRYPPWEPDTAASGAFDDFGGIEAAEDAYPQRFWFTPAKLDDVHRLERYLERQPGMGKTVSVGRLEAVARTFNDGEPLDYVQLTSVLSLVPEDVRERLLEPYAAPASGELRIAGRIHETGPRFSRSELIEGIQRFAEQELGFAPGEVHVTGMAVLFDDMLRKLLRSQTSTILIVVGTITLLFAVLLRSLALALAGLLPNLLSAGILLAGMSVFGIPLDLMTIAVAAIVIGIGVDDAIHYLHRFREERAAGHSVPQAIEATHRSIGRALYYTTAVVILGFSVLSLSSFVPTIHFGVLTALAMLVALVANLALLPSLLLVMPRRWTQAPGDRSPARIPAEPALPRP